MVEVRGSRLSPLCILRVMKCGESSTHHVNFRSFGLYPDPYRLYNADMGFVHLADPDLHNKILECLRKTFVYDIY